MNIYFISPISININSWRALLDAMNIECVVDLLMYKQGVDNPFNCNHEVFDSISIKHNINDLIPEGYINYPKEKKSNTYKRKIQKIFRDLVKCGVDRYKFREPTDRKSVV